MQIGHIGVGGEAGLEGGEIKERQTQSVLEKIENYS